MDLMLIVSPVNLRYKWMPLYYLYLAGYLEKHGFKISIVEPHFKNIDQNIKFILNEVKEKKPKFIGFASFVTDYNVVHDLALQVRKISDAITLVGNAQPSITPEDYVYDGSPFDIVVRGEGELTTKAILESKCDIDSLYKIEGISFFDKDKVRHDGKKGVVVTNKNRGLISMEDLGMPAYHLIDMDWYTTPTKYIIRRITTVGAGIYTGRGCPYKCNFCASNVVWNANDKTKGNPSVRWRPMDMVMEDLSILQNKYGVDFFYVQDDTFGIHEPHIHKFCETYKSSGLKMLWGAQTRTACIKTPEIIKLLRDSGCIQLDFGVESGSPKLLKILKKLTTVEDTHRAFDLCHKYGMRTFANMMVNLAGETEEDIHLSHKLMEKIKPTFTGVGVTQPYPGTEIYRNLGFKIDKKDYHLLDRTFPPEKFRVAEHKLDLRKLVYDCLKRYKVETFFESSVLTGGYDYWKKILTSKHRFRYLFYIIKTFLGAPIVYLLSRYQDLMGYNPSSSDPK